MKCTGFEPESYAFYVLGTASDEEARRITSHLAMECETCVAEIAACEKLWCDVGLTTPQVRAPASLRGKILAGIEPRPQHPRRKYWVPALAGGVAAAAISIAVLQTIDSREILPNIVYSPRIIINSEAAPAATPIVPGPVATAPAPSPSASPQDDTVLQTLRNELAAEREKSAQLETQIRVAPPIQPTQQPSPLPIAPRTENTAELQRLRDRVTSLERQVTQYQTLLEIERRRADRTTQIAGMITSPQLKIVPLKGTERVPAAEGRVLVSGNSQLVFVASGLPAPPPRRTYQLWIIRSDKPAIASAGTFDPDRENRAVLQLASPLLLKNVTAFAVTDEPAGGSAQPTGQKWLIGL